MKAADEYSSAFYDEVIRDSLGSAEIVVQFLYDLLQPKSVLDVGCGMGNWLRAFEAAGSQLTHGIEGPWARTNESMVRPEQITWFDFSTASIPIQPPLPQDRFDLVTSFEFAEHIDPGFADPLVDMLTSLSDTIVLGAALPIQGGIHHVNEQWPSYWSNKFAARGFVACDIIRAALWDDTRIAPWYRQNSVVYFRGAVPEKIAMQANSYWQDWSSKPRSLVIPEMWFKRSDAADESFKNIRRITEAVTRNFFKQLFDRK